MAKEYNRSNCDSTLRATVTDQLGRTVSLFGTHAFEWSIVIASDNSITMQTFSKGGRYDIPLVVCNTQEMGKEIRDVL